MTERHEEFAGFGCYRRIYWRAELEYKMGRVGGGDGEVGTDVANEEPARFLVQIRWTSEEARQKGTKCGQRDQTAPVFHEEFGGEIGVASLDAGASFVYGEFSQDVVVVQTPAGAF
jgi:hypothetical protein